MCVFQFYLLLWWYMQSSRYSVWVCEQHESHVVCQSMTGFFKDFCWMISLNKISLLFCLCAYVWWFWWWRVRVYHCVFVLARLGADLRRPSGELRHVSAVAVPQSGLCPHALSLYHRPGGHVFPGHCPVFPGWQGEGRETVSDSDIVGITHHYFIYYLVICSLNI